MAVAKLNGMVKHGSDGLMGRRASLKATTKTVETPEHSTTNGSTSISHVLGGGGENIQRESR